MKNLYNSHVKKSANNFLKKLVLFLLMQYAATCHTITLTNYHFTWCSGVINVIFNICFGIITYHISKFYFRLF
jgi:hypothetical protein